MENAMIYLNTTTPPLAPQNQVGAAPQLSDVQPGSQYQGTPQVHNGAPITLGAYAHQPCHNAQPQQGAHMQGGFVNVVKQHHTGAESQQMEEVQTAAIPTDQCARVSIGMGFTKNLGDYQSFRATVSVELPCHVDQVQSGLEAAQQIARERMFKLWNEG